MHRIEVLGPGCTRCKETLRVVQHVVESAGIQVELVKEESYARMATLGIMSTPAVVVDGIIVIAGRIPKAQEIRELLGIS
ncbi:MAG: TM0996/MTH895 family glutaredoxin-like protein [Acidobacteria bacterium]|nr:TM0996/MTH895 family glutaredoxin-like protein [Acidobacteriota bacterium]